MADQVTDAGPQITNDNVEKIKDPQKVEQGKKLAAISKAAKERARKKKIESHKVETDSWNVDYGYVVGTVGVLTAVGALYFAYRADRVTKVPKTTNLHVVPCAQAPVTKVQPKTRVDQESHIEMFD